MKKVVFVCIVSLAVCFVAGNSIPAQEVTPPPTPKVPKPETITPKASVPDTHDASTTIHTVSTTAANPAHVTTETKVTTEAKPDNQTTTPASPSSTTKPPTPPTSTTTPAPGKKNETLPATTPKAEGSTKAAEPEPQLARGFDGPSFTGGIILTLGLLAIGFIGFKYYKNQTERNYHTL